MKPDPVFLRRRGATRCVGFLLVAALSVPHAHAVLANGVRESPDPSLDAHQAANPRLALAALEADEDWTECPRVFDPVPWTPGKGYAQGVRQALSIETRLPVDPASGAWESFTLLRRAVLEIDRTRLATLPLSNTPEIADWRLTLGAAEIHAPEPSRKTLSIDDRLLLNLLRQLEQPSLTVHFQVRTDTGEVALENAEDIRAATRVRVDQLLALVRKGALFSEAEQERLRKALSRQVIERDPNIEASTLLISAILRPHHLSFHRSTEILTQDQIAWPGPGGSQTIRAHRSSVLSRYSEQADCAEIRYATVLDRDDLLRARGGEPRPAHQKPDLSKVAVEESTVLQRIELSSGRTWLIDIRFYAGTVREKSQTRTTIRFLDDLAPASK
ncbi:hypothetical protein [Sphaerotilus mobilis]|uniref:Uncharacterized protein n=1 Tax=Sphaerotilus mobilis TaxID=47994 RepID=A0A4Q7LTH2_9BURK|nr:hypothetical protein [Sphaerotilus mobilis]RZS57089.1 hypothetical protein EV685_1652 [Sphaerotilus mobilis]